VSGPFPGFPVPLEGDLDGKAVTELIEQHRDELPFSDQLPHLTRRLTPTIVRC